MPGFIFRTDERARLFLRVLDDPKSPDGNVKMWKKTAGDKVRSILTSNDRELFIASAVVANFK